MSIEQQIGYCSTADGVRIAYGTYGNDDAPPLVYWPDMPTQEAIWASTWGRAFIEELAQHRRLVTFDGPGFGASQRAWAGFQPTDLMRFMEVVVDHLRLDEFELFGGGIAPSTGSITYASAHAERVSKLVLFDPKVASSEVDERIADSIRGSFSVFCRSVGTVFFPSGPPDVQRWFSRAVRDVVVAEQLEAFLRVRFDLSSTLGGLTLPVLILHRKQSQVVGNADVRTVASLIPGARLVTLDGDVGAPFWDYEQYIGVLREFLGMSNAVESAKGRHGDSSSGTAVIMFTDIASSTELTERMGDVRFRDASRSLDVGLRAAIREAGGEAIEGKLLGDGVLATFGSAAQAIDAARRCLALSAASELGLHIGLHAGDVIREDNNVYGGAVNIAARICGLSAPGEILVSDVVRGMGRSSAGVVFENRGEHEMKGVGEPVRVYAVRGAE